jgi:hypothetical protein
MSTAALILVIKVGFLSVFWAVLDTTTGDPVAHGRAFTMAGAERKARRAKDSL